MQKIERTLLDSLYEPTVIKLNRDGSVNRIRGAEELRARAEKFLSGRVARIKRIENKHRKLGCPPEPWALASRPTFSLKLSREKSGQKRVENDTAMVVENLITGVPRRSRIRCILDLQSLERRS